MKPVRIAGVDCAVDPAKIGVALGEMDGEGCRILEAKLCSASEPPEGVLERWHRQAPLDLLALDAPLGWPVALSQTLPWHSAGCGIQAEPQQLFTRLSDREIHTRLKKKPLEVGADRIARTAVAALKLLETLRRSTGEEFPLAWQSLPPAQPSAIEVYPAATIRASGLPIVSYKKPPQRDARQTMLESLPKKFAVEAYREVAMKSADVLDAILCVLAGWNFCRGLSVPPDDLLTAKREGWIWAGRADGE